MSARSSLGLVRSGVAPDRRNIKSVARSFETTAEQPRFRCYGNGEVGRDVARDELLERYDLSVERAVVIGQRF